MSGGLTRTGDWLGQPRGLTVLFLTEMWEKFSFYGMRALLVYYMTKQLMIPQAQASLIYGIYTALVYLTPIFGGVIADRWLGRRKAVIIGGSMMALGHLLMTFEGSFYPALAAIALGNGLFLPSLPSQIDALYAVDDPRRKSAYSVYYMGVNLGAFLAPLGCGAVGEIWGWHWGFGLAGIGMGVGLLIYILGGRHLPADTRIALKVEGAAPVGFGSSLAVLLAIVGAVVVFRMAYEQTGNTIALWADQGIDRALSADWSIPMTWFQSLNPLLVFILTPILVTTWTRRAARGREPSAATRMAVGAALVAAAFVAIGVASFLSAQRGEPTSWVWLAGFFILLTWGELHILPTGLGLFGRLAPAGLGATAIAIWFFAAFAGNLLAGGLGMLWSSLRAFEFFFLTAGVAGLSAVLLLLLVPAVRRLEARERRGEVQP